VFSWVVGILGGFGTLILVWVLFPVVATFFGGLLLEDLAKTLEFSHYPNDLPGRDLTLAGGIVAGLQFTVVAITANLFGLLVYALLLTTVILAPLAPVVFYLVNGYLLGRECFDMVALRHMNRDAARKLREANKGRVWRAGAVVAFLFTIPFVNLVAPVFGIAVMVHILRGMRAVRAPNQ